MAYGKGLVCIDEFWSLVIFFLVYNKVLNEFVLKQFFGFFQVQESKEKLIPFLLCEYATILFLIK